MKRKHVAVVRLVLVLVVLVALAAGGVASVAVGFAWALADPDPTEGPGAMGLAGLCAGAAMLVGFAMVWRWFDLREALVQERRYRDVVTLPRDFGPRVRFITRAALRRLDR